MTVVRILVEHVDKYFVATGRDDVGELAQAGDHDRKKAVRKCQNKCRDVLGPEEEVEFLVNDL